MKGSLKLATVAGIGIYVHWTFLILIVWITLSNYSQGSDPANTMLDVALVLAVFGCVVLHELGHALTAKRYGIMTRDITLLPIGGLARLTRIPEDPKQELWIALAGPAVNVVLAILFSIVILLTGMADQIPEEITDAVQVPFLVKLTAINVVLAVFNMIPAFPMDGGRVLRAILARYMNHARATQIAASIGQGLAIVFGLLGAINGNWIAVFVGLFVYFGAQQEAQMVLVKSLMSGVPVRSAMITRFQTLHENDPLDIAIDQLLAGAQQDFPVVDGDHIVGILVRSDLFAALAGGKRDALVGDVMRRECNVAHEGEMLSDTFDRMREAGCPILPVVRGDKLVGMVTLENVGEWMMIQTAIQNASDRSHVDDLWRHNGNPGRPLI